MKEVIKELETFKKDLEERIGINVKFEVSKLVEYLEEIGVENVEELVESEISDILELKISKIDFEEGLIYLFVRNAFGTGNDGRFNRIVVFDKDGYIIDVLNGYEEKLKEIDVYDLIQLYALNKEYGCEEELKELCNEAINDLFE